MARCVLVRAGRCLSVEAGDELPPLRAHPFLRDAAWCGRCEARHKRARVERDGGGFEEVAQWPADEDGVGSICSVCAHTGRGMKGCDGPCGGYFVTCEARPAIFPRKTFAGCDRARSRRAQGCSVKILGLPDARARAAMGDDLAAFHCVFCRPGARAALADAAYSWLASNKAFLVAVRKRARAIETCAAAAPAEPVGTPWADDEAPPAMRPPPPRSPRRRQKQPPAANGGEPAAPPAPPTAPNAAESAAGPPPPLARVPGAVVPPLVRVRGIAMGAPLRVVRAGASFRYAEGLRHNHQRRLSRRLAPLLRPADFSVAEMPGEAAGFVVFLHICGAPEQPLPEAGLLRAVRDAAGPESEALFAIEARGRLHCLIEDGVRRGVKRPSEADDRALPDARERVFTTDLRLLARTVAEAAAAPVVVNPRATDAQVIDAFARYVRDDPRRPARARFYARAPAAFEGTPAQLLAELLGPAAAAAAADDPAAGGSGAGAGGDWGAGAGAADGGD